MKKKFEQRNLAKFACDSNFTRGRLYPDDDLQFNRTEYQRDRDRILHSEAFRRLKNRLKFGTEGALFTGALAGIGTTIGKLRDTTRVGKVADSKFNKFLDKWVSGKLRARQGMTPEQFRQQNLLKGARAADLSGAETIVRQLDDKISKLFPFMKRAWGDKTTYDARRELLKDMNKMLLSSADDPNNLIPKISTITKKVVKHPFHFVGTV